jgi:hypothetical protein
MLRDFHAVVSAAETRETTENKQVMAVWKNNILKILRA